MAAGTGHGVDLSWDLNKNVPKEDKLASTHTWKEQLNPAYPVQSSERNSQALNGPTRLDCNKIPAPVIKSDQQ